MGLIFVFAPIAFIFLGSQIYWALRIFRFLGRRISAAAPRILVQLAVLGFYAFLVAYNFGWFGRSSSPIRLTLSEALLNAPFQWWVASSMVAFLIVILCWLAKQLAQLTRWIFRRRTRELPSPARRAWLEQATTAAVAAPFVAGAYGFFYGRLNLQTTAQPIRLTRLPKAFEGFRIAQLSDIHIGPFMSEDQIRKYVAITNALKPDLIVLTGDFVTWDADTQQPVVRVLSALRAPYGVFGCLGNHDAWAGVEDSISTLFAQTGIRILRGERVSLTAHKDSLNLLGVDYQNSGHLRIAGRGHGSERPLEGIEGLIAPDTANILLSHNPDTFDRAAELGIDLSLAGHTHGGQVALEFISPELAPSRIVTPYVAGWFQQPGGQLYVNRGIGTIGVPIRIGAPPEITVFELSRSV